jgi:HEAT repeat protein
MTKKQHFLLCSITAIAVLVVLLGLSVFLDFFQQQWYIKKLHSPDQEEVQNAVLQLSSKRALRAVPAFIEVVRRSDAFVSRVENALAQMGPMAVSWIAAAVEQDSRDVLDHAQNIAGILDSGDLLDLSMTKEAPCYAIENLMTVITTINREREPVEDRDFSVGEAAFRAVCVAVNALAMIGSRIDSELQSLDANKSSRLVLAIALANNGGDSAAAMECFCRLLEDKHWFLRKVAIEGMERMSHKPTSIIPRVQNALKDPHPVIRIEATRALGNFGPEAASTVSAIVHGPLKEWYKDVALEAIRKLNPKADVILPALFSSMRGELRRQLDSLEKGGPEDALDSDGMPSKSMSRIEELLGVSCDVLTLTSFRDQSKLIEYGNGDYAEKLLSAKLLRTLGLLKKDAVPFLRSGLEEPYWYVRVEMLRALAELAHEGTNALPSIVVVLKDNKDIVREWALKAFISLGPDPEVLMPTLIQSLRDPYWAVREASLLALGNANTGGGLAIMPLLELLNDEKDLRSEVKQTLEQLGRTTSGRQRLKEALLDTRDYMRFWAAIVLMRLAEGLRYGPGFHCCCDC